MSYTLQDLAVRLAPSLRDKFDLSDPEDYDKWAELSFKAAAAHLKKLPEWETRIQAAIKEQAELRLKEATK